MKATLRHVEFEYALARTDEDINALVRASVQNYAEAVGFEAAGGRLQVIVLSVIDQQTGKAVALTDAEHGGIVDRAYDERNNSADKCAMSRAKEGED